MFNTIGMKRYFARTTIILAGMAFTANAQQQAGTTGTTKQSSEAKMASTKSIAPTKPLTKKEPQRVVVADL